MNKNIIFFMAFFPNYTITVSPVPIDPNQFMIPIERDAGEESELAREQELTLQLKLKIAAIITIASLITGTITSVVTAYSKQC